MGPQAGIIKTIGETFVTEEFVPLYKIEAVAA